MLQLYELCRLCAQKKRKKLDIFSGLEDEEAKILLAKISLCLSVQVTKEDMLPKMICIDCQKAVEQFNAFRVKCHKAEERLNKMLSLASPNKLTVTQIKEECSESDFPEFSSIQLTLDSPKFSEYITHSNLKSISNVKSEVDELQGDIQWNSISEPASSDLIQIISEEIVSHQNLDDIKQPQIEIISENYNDDFKNIHFSETENNSCDIKVIPESQFLLGAEFGTPLVDENFQIEESRTFPEIKEQTTDTESESEFNSTGVLKKNQSNLIDFKENHHKLKDGKYEKVSESETSEEEIDEKYLTLNEGEICDIDLEEMDALIKKKQDPNATFQCDKCNKSFKFFKCLRKHKHWHNSQPKVFICDICKSENVKSFEFSSLKSLSNHLQRKHLFSNSKTFQCNLCSKILQSLGQLNAHHKRVHDNLEASCQTCGKIFKNRARLNGHLKVHQDERPYVCDQCGQSFKWSNALKVHILWHKQEKNFLCSECGKKFTAKKNLIEHLNIHVGKRPYVCKECGATFIQFSAYSKHLYLHNEERRIHKCNKCDKTFSHAYVLKQHLFRHTGLRPFECSTCHNTFKSQSDLGCHAKIHQEKQYGCQVCGRKFAVSKTLRDHMVRHTGIKHICPVPGCGKTYTQRFSLSKHFSKSHPSLAIVRKKRGKKPPLEGKSSEETDFIRYEFKEKAVSDSLRGA